MTRLSFSNLGLVLALAACSSGGGSNGTGGTGGGGTGTGGGTSGGSAGKASGTGGSTGGTGTGGSTGGTGTGGTGTGGSTGGTGMGGTGTGGTAGMGVTGGTGGTTGGTGGTSIAGMGQTGGGAGTGAGGMPGGAGTSPGGSGPGGSAGTSSMTGPVTVNLGMAEQTIDGFGINDTWAPAMSDSDATAMFSVDKGMGLSILRVGMNDQGAVMSSNITADITKAKAAGATKIIGSCWSPPANCKTNNSINDGGHVNSSCYDSWSTTITNFAKSNGLYAMSIANEPDFASCGSSDPCNGNYPTTVYTANEMVAFLKVAGPKLQAANIKVIAPEASEWIHTWSNTSAGPDVGGKNSSDPLKCGFPATMCTAGNGYDYGHAMYADKTAWAAFDIMGVHEYDTQKAEPWPADVPDKKPVWQTEMSGVKWWPEQGPSSDIANGVAVAGWVHSALVDGQASAWVWWWWTANNTDDNEGIYLKSGTDTKRHYTITNYSRFIRPGYTRVDVTGAAPANVLLSAYKGSDGTVVIVAINNGMMDQTVPITISGGTAPAMLTPWVTSAMDNLVSKTAVAVSSGAFMASFPAQTVTTYVGK
jgi:glucuronoarabinoxylan endo-1,4-beta-xylanase